MITNHPTLSNLVLQDYPQGYILSYFYNRPQALSTRGLSLYSSSFYHCPQVRQITDPHRYSFSKNLPLHPKRGRGGYYDYINSLNILYWNQLNCWIGKINHKCLYFCTMKALQKIISISHYICMHWKYPLPSQGKRQLDNEKFSQKCTTKMYLLTRTIVILSFTCIHLIFMFTVFK